MLELENRWMSNGLRLIKKNSRSEPVKTNDQMKDSREGFNAWLKSIWNGKKGFAVAYLDQRVLVGRFNEALSFHDDEAFHPRYLVHLRVFDEDCELFLWRTRGGLKGRMRIDGDDDSPTVYAVDVCQALFGTRYESAGDGYLRLMEERGTEIVLPFSDPSGFSDGNRGTRAFLMTRNYIGPNPATRQSGYVDCRFLKLIPGGLLEKEREL